MIPAIDFLVVENDCWVLEHDSGAREWVSSVVEIAFCTPAYELLGQEVTVWYRNIAASVPVRVLALQFHVYINKRGFGGAC